MAKPTSVDEYCQGFSGTAAALLADLRTLSTTAAPDAVEAIRWGYPSIVHAGGTILYMFSAHKNHASIAFTPSTREAFTGDLADFETGKGSVKLPYDDPLPLDLLARMIKFRIDEYEEGDVKWM